MNERTKQPKRSSAVAKRHSLDRLVSIAVANHTPGELARGYIRYETVRKLTPRTFGIMYRMNLSGATFDDLIDDAASDANVKVSDAPGSAAPKRNDKTEPLPPDSERGRHSRP